MKAFYENRLYDSDTPIFVSESHSLNFLAHWHNDVEFVYVCDGNLTVGINKEKRTLKQGELAVISGGDIHYYDSTDMSSIAVMVIFRPIITGSSGRWPETLYFNSPFINKNQIEEIEKIIDTHIRIKDIFNQLLWEYNQKNDFYHMFLKSRVIELCALSLRYFPSFSQDLRTDCHRRTSIKMMQNTLNHLEHNYMHDITLDDAAKSINLSTYYFSRLFKEVCGMNFKPYLNSIRVEKAENLVKNSSKNIVDIAFECGFNSIRTFNRVFKEIKGYTPSSLS